MQGYDDLMERLIAEVSSQLSLFRKEVREDLHGLSQQINDNSGRVSSLQVHIAKLQQRNEDQVSVCTTHQKSVADVAQRVNNVEQSVASAHNRIDAVVSQGKAVEDAKEKTANWFRWIVPHLWQIGLAIGAITAGIGYLVKQLEVK